MSGTRGFFCYPYKTFKMYIFSCKSRNSRPSQQKDRGQNKVRLVNTNIKDTGVILVFSLLTQNVIIDLFHSSTFKLNSKTFTRTPLKRIKVYIYRFLGGFSALRYSSHANIVRERPLLCFTARQSCTSSSLTAPCELITVGIVATVVNFDFISLDIEEKNTIK